MLDKSTFQNRSKTSQDGSKHNSEQLPKPEFRGDFARYFSLFLPNDTNDQERLRRIRVSIGEELADKTRLSLIFFAFCENLKFQEKIWGGNHEVSDSSFLQSEPSSPAFVHAIKHNFSRNRYNVIDS